MAAWEVLVKVDSEADGRGGVTKIATFDKVTKDKVNVMMEEESRSVSVTYDDVISRMLTPSTCIPTRCNGALILNTAAKKIQETDFDIDGGTCMKVGFKPIMHKTPSF